MKIDASKRKSDFLSTNIEVSAENDNPIKALSNFIFVESNHVASDIILIPGSDEVELIQKASELYNLGLAPIILISGGTNNNIKSHSSEADFFAEAAINNNVPKEALILEDKARNTFENARFSFELLQNKNIKINSAILVTKAYHSRRALLTYQRYFWPQVKLSVCTVPGADDISKENWFKDVLRTNIVMGEIIKIGAYFESEVPEYVSRVT